ncbi:TPA: hypothetical protein IBD53_002215 [Escherichia coli]|nr:hypothetical protein [Escherichia coli]
MDNQCQFLMLFMGHQWACMGHFLSAKFVEVRRHGKRIIYPTLEKRRSWTIFVDF